VLNLTCCLDMNKNSLNVNAFLFFSSSNICNMFDKSIGMKNIDLLKCGFTRKQRKKEDKLIIWFANNTRGETNKRYCVLKKYKYITRDTIKKHLSIHNVKYRNTMKKLPEKE